MNSDHSNPFVGLRPFQENESLLFFGRNEQILELLQRLHSNRFLAVIGSSGCGKSSLIRAGLIPALKAGYLVDDSNKWLIAKMKPGEDPLLNMAQSILNGLNLNSSEEDIRSFLDQIIETGSQVIIDKINSVCAEHNANFFLLIDQFEELFRFSSYSSTNRINDNAIDFVNLLLSMSSQSEFPIYVVITMRADFLGDCSNFYGLPEAINRSQYLVPRLTRQKLTAIIEGPIKLYGGKISASLRSLLINSLGHSHDQLPLLQHTLMRLWDSGSQTELEEIKISDYHAIGGIEKALSNHILEAIESSNNEDLEIIKKLFQALTSVDENNRKVRRPVKLSYLADLTNTSQNKLIKLINLFVDRGRSFLIVNDIVNSTDKLIDISHESLIRQWNLLNDWVEEETSNANNYKALSLAYESFYKNQRGYLTSKELEIFLTWLEDFRPTKIWSKRYDSNFDEAIKFLNESKQVSQKEKFIAAAKKRKQRNLMIGLAVVLPLLAVSIIYGISIHNKNLDLEEYRGKIEKYTEELSNERKKAKKAEDLAEQSLIDLKKYISSDIENLTIQDSFIKQRILDRLDHYLPEENNLNKQSSVNEINENDFIEKSNSINIWDEDYDLNLIAELMPSAPEENLKKFIYGFNSSLTAKEINTPERLVAFLAVVASESKELTDFDTKYYDNSEQLLSKYNDAFSDIENIELYAGNPQKIANLVNANIGGNGDEQSNDGWNYRGRGIMKIRYKGRYKYYTENTNYDLINNPDLLSDIVIATDIACYIWVYKLGGAELVNKLADDKDFESIASLILTNKQDKTPESFETLMDYYKKGCILFNIK